MMNCHGKDEQYAKLLQFIAEGKDRDEVLAAFVRDFGSEDVLARPRDRGFNRLIWLFPYVVAAGALAAVTIAARRWSRPAPVRAGGTTAPTDPALDARLDDELRDLD